MILLYIIGIIYLSVGILYGLYIFLFGGDTWLSLPVNILFGPIVIIYYTYKVLTKKPKRIYE